MNRNAGTLIRSRGARTLTAAAVVLAAFFIGRATVGSRHTAVPAHEEPRGESHAELWTCSMHPQIKLPKPGKCPICFMDLIPLVDGGAGADRDTGSRLTLSESARRLAQIVVVPAVRRGVSSDIRLSGKIAFDETRQATISSRVEGRIDRLFVNATGVQVRAGDHLAQIYSPELLSAQQELLGAAGFLARLPVPGDTALRANARATLDAARAKMRRLGFRDRDMDAVLAAGSADEHMTLRSTQAGVVIEKMAVEGAYVQAGMPLYRVADLSTVWAKLDAYESDIAWLRLGQRVELGVEAFPGETFTGTLSFIDPVVDPMARTVKVRVSVPNRDGKLKPEMMVRALVKARVSASGKVLNASLRGKWISPMHPEIVKNGPGTCDVCGMPLVPAESLGYVTSGFESMDPLVIPATAPLLTGARAIVYVETASDSAGATYEGREVVLGPRVGDSYVVKSGLAEGEKVAVNGAFRIDSELQIRARPSMMNPQGGGSGP